MGDPIVVGVDGTGDSLVALGVAADRAEENAAPIVAVHVRHQTSLSSMSDVAAEAVVLNEALDEVEATTRERVSDALAGRHVDWRLEVRAGEPAAELIRVAGEVGAHSIVVGGRSHGVVGGLVLGSVAQRLVRKSPVSVLVVRDGHAQRVADVPATPPR
jgi:nucleotide-binding universal stress UspA family protein